MSQEPIIYQDRNVTVTTSRVTFADKTYALANITSVEVSKEKPRHLLSWALILFGGLGTCFYVVIAPQAEGGALCIMIALVIVAVGLLVYYLQSKNAEYTVMLSSSASEIQATSSKDEAYVKRVAQAIRDAIVQRG